MKTNKECLNCRFYNDFYEDYCELHDMLVSEIYICEKHEAELLIMEKEMCYKMFAKDISQ